MRKRRFRYWAIATMAGLLTMSALPNAILASPASTLSGTGFVDQTPQELTEGLLASTEEALPSHVFVLDNRLVVTELPPDHLNSSRGGTKQPAPSGDTVMITLTVLPARLIVVDNDDNITSISSNTTGKDFTFYSLAIREGHLQGQEHPLTKKILSQYNCLLNEVNWSDTGTVYGQESVWSF